MRTLCDVCESAAATLFCAADEAALCVGCDEKVHLCNKLASRHIRVGLAAPNDVPRCDICETTPAFFYCEIDGTSLCLQCDTIVHVGGKRSHERYLLLRQRVEFPVDKSAHSEDLALHLTDPSDNRREPNHLPKMTMRENVQNHKMPAIPTIDAKTDTQYKMDTKMIDLNIRPNGSHGTHGQASSNQDQGMDVLSGGNHESHSYDPARLSQR